MCIFFLHTFYWLVTVAINRNKPVPRLLAMRKKWARGLVKLVHFDLKITGEKPPDEVCLFVGNHRSSLDPLILLSDVSAYPVSRAEVRNWPLIGKGGSITGIVFVDKSDRESRAWAKEQLLREMQSGKSILIFPEGKTNVKPLTSTFLKGSFDQAAAGGFPVVPMVLEYKYKTDYWDHSDSFFMHFIKNFGKKSTPIRIKYGPALRSDNSWTLLRGAQNWIDENIVEVRKEWDEVEAGEVQVASKP